MLILDNAMKVLVVDDGPLMIAFSLLGITTLFLLGKAWRRYLEAKKPFPNVPMAKGSHFFFGHAKDMFTADNFQEAFQRINVDSANEYGQTGFWVANPGSSRPARTKWFE